MTRDWQGLWYDSWKCTDVAMERAPDAEDALDKYEQKVWDELVEQYETQHGEGVPRDIMDDYRDQMFDWMNDNLSPKDAAEIILESRSDKRMDDMTYFHADKNSIQP